MIFAEHSEHGYLAAPIAKHIIETYYARKEGRPLPELPPLPAAAPAVTRVAGTAPPPITRPAPAAPAHTAPAVPSAPASATRPGPARPKDSTCSNAASPPISTGRCSWPSWRSSRLAWR